MNDYMQRLRQNINRSNFSGGGGGGSPRGAGGAVFGAVLLMGGAYFFSNALYNVDGGHRAIKYKRISGVGKEIYNEGESRLIRASLLKDYLPTVARFGLLTLLVFW